MAEPKLHVIKTWPSYFAAVADGRKRFELRRNDRDYAEGDILRLVEWDPAKFSYGGGATGRVLHVHVTYKAQGVFGLPEGLCVLSITPLQPPVFDEYPLVDSEQDRREAVALLAEEPAYVR